jgi:hypothetical protein
MAVRVGFNVSLRDEEKGALEFLSERYPAHFPAKADVVRLLIDQRMVQELGPEWRKTVSERRRMLAESEAA